MGMTERALVVFFLLEIFCGLNVSNAEWLGPENMVTGDWGNGSGQFGKEIGDNADICPVMAAVTADGKMIVTDPVNRKQLVFDTEGELIEEVPWVLNGNSTDATEYFVPRYSYGFISGFSSDGNMYVSSGDKFYLVSESGEVVEEYDNRPIDLGTITRLAIGKGQYLITIEYPNDKWEFLTEDLYKRYLTDMNGNLHGVGNEEVVRYDAEGTEIGKLRIPSVRSESTHSGVEGIEANIFVLEEYGQPVLAFSGDVYTWKRTPENYYIVKWTWVDDSI